MQLRHLLPPLLLLSTGSLHAQISDPIFRSGFETVGAITANWQANLNAHNAVRAGVSPAASPALPIMQWNESVAATAQVHADRCVFEHSGNPGLGENIYALGAWADVEEDAALYWALEAANYNYGSNSCAPGQQCGHYTQMVWRSSTNLGCGIRQCNSGSPWGSGEWSVVVCNYSPPGNYIGVRPY
ncbi:MAG: CAP domain-containing protein [Dokdonella sp.]